MFGRTNIRPVKNGLYTTLLKQTYQESVRAPISILKEPAGHWFYIYLACRQRYKLPLFLALIWHLPGLCLPGLQAAISATFPCIDLTSTWPAGSNTSYHFSLHWFDIYLACVYLACRQQYQLPFLALIWHLHGLQAAIQATFPSTDLTSTWPAGVDTSHLSLHWSDIYLARRQRHKSPFLALIWHLPGLQAVIQTTFPCTDLTSTWPDGTDLTSTWPAGSHTNHLSLPWFNIYLACRQ